MPRHYLIISAAAALLAASFPTFAETKPPLLHEPRLHTPSAERMLVRTKADRLAARIRFAPAPDPLDIAPLLPRPGASGYLSPTDQRMEARAQASIDAVMGASISDLWRIKRDAALADLADARFWALHALRTFRPDPAAGPEGR